MSGGFLVLEIAGAAFAVDESFVVEVAEATATTRLPFAPPHVEGIANVAGHLLPVVDLTGYPTLDLAWRGDRRGGLFIVLRSGRRALALRAGRIGGTLDSASVRLAGADGVDDGASPVAARFEHAGRALRLIAPDRVQLGHGMAFADGAEDAALVGVAASPLDAEIARPNVRLLVVEAGGRSYALRMADIVLVFAVDSLRPLPNAPAVVRGVAQVQRHPVLLADPLGSFTGTAGTPSGHAVVHATPRGPVGVRVDTVRGVVRFFEDEIKAEDGKDGSAPDEIVEYDGSWLDVVSGARMLGEHLDEIGGLIPDTRDLDDSRLPHRHYRRFLTFTVDGQVYAVEFERVRRVVESSERLRLPAGAETFDGITDVDGAILPVLDLRRLLTRRPVGADPDRFGTAILVDIAGGTVAVVADEVQRIRKISIDDVDPMSDRLTAAVIRQDGALIPVLRPEGLLSEAPSGRETSLPCARGPA